MEPRTKMTLGSHQIPLKNNSLRLVSVVALLFGRTSKWTSTASVRTRWAQQCIPRANRPQARRTIWVFASSCSLTTRSLLYLLEWTPKILLPRRTLNSSKVRIMQTCPMEWAIWCRTTCKICIITTSISNKRCMMRSTHWELGLAITFMCRQLTLNLVKWVAVGRQWWIHSKRRSLFTVYLAIISHCKCMVMAGSLLNLVLREHT